MLLYEGKAKQVYSTENENEYPPGKLPAGSFL